MDLNKLQKAAFVCLLLLCRSSCYSQSNAAEPKIDFYTFPKTLSIQGTTYSFNEDLLLRNFSLSLDDVQEAQQGLKGKSIDGQPPDKDFLLHRIKVNKATLAYCIIAAGSFLQPSDKLNTLFERAKTLIGEDTLPEGVILPQNQFLGIAAACFQNQNGQSFAGDIDNEQITFSELIQFSRWQMLARQKP